MEYTGYPGKHGLWIHWVYILISEMDNVQINNIFSAHDMYCKCGKNG